MSTMKTAMASLPELVALVDRGVEYPDAHFKVVRAGQLSGWKAERLQQAYDDRTAGRTAACTACGVERCVTCGEALYADNKYACSDPHPEARLDPSDCPECPTYGYPDGCR